MMVVRKEMRRDVGREWLLKRLPKNNQKGFTLIELLVVMSILGILAAIVTMSMVGITSVATQRAASTELQSVQIAYDAMLADRGVAATSSCPGGGATSNMKAFPTGSSTSSAGPHDPVALYPSYLRQETTHGVYHCKDQGVVVQDSYTP